MKTLIFRSFLLVLAGSMLMSCAVVDVLKSRASQTEEVLPQFSPVDISGKVASKEYMKKVDNFLVILDASSSMGEDYQGASKLSLGTHFLGNMYQTLPTIDLQGGLRTFGLDSGVSKHNTMLVQGMMAYNQGTFRSFTRSVNRPGGTTPMGTGIGAGINDLKPTKGKTAVIIVSDWKDVSPGATEAVRSLKGQFGDRVCVYPVMVGDNGPGKNLMNSAAQIGQCGFAREAASLASGQAMASYVEKIFLASTGDDDRDGVFNPLDQCPGTPQGVAVDSKGCPLDTDRDGVYDYLDKCPGTPRGVKVNGVGCPLDSDVDGINDSSDQCPNTPMGAKVTPVGCWTYGEVLFGSNTAQIKSESHPVLDEIYQVLRKNPGMSVGIEGHTDSRGNEAYNMSLSQKRAEAVGAYLNAKGINSDNLLPQGFGMTKPRASNDTKEGRAQNRRVVFIPIY